MPTFKQDLELLNHNNPTETPFTAESYAELATELANVYGACVVGSQMRSLGAFSTFYAVDATRNFGMLYTAESDIKRAINNLRRYSPVPPKPKKVIIPEQHSDYLKDAGRAVDYEIDRRNRVNRMIELPEKFKRSVQRDDDGDFISGSNRSTGQHIVNGLLTQDPEAMRLFSELMILAPQREEWV